MGASRLKWGAKEEMDPGRELEAKCSGWMDIEGSIWPLHTSCGMMDPSAGTRLFLVRGCDSLCSSIYLDTVLITLKLQLLFTLS